MQCITHTVEFARVAAIVVSMPPNHAKKYRTINIFAKHVGRFRVGNSPALETALAAPAIASSVAKTSANIITQRTAIRRCRVLHSCVWGNVSAIPSRPLAGVSCQKAVLSAKKPADGYARHRPACATYHRQRHHCIIGYVISYSFEKFGIDRGNAGLQNMGQTGAINPTSTQAPARIYIAILINTPASRACAAFSLRGSPRNMPPNAFVKDATAKPPISANPPMTGKQRRIQVMPPSFIKLVAPASTPQIYHQLTHKTIQRRQAGDRARTDQKRAARVRHPFQQPPQPIHLARACAVLNRTSSHKQKALKQRMIDNV